MSKKYLMIVNPGSGKGSEQLDFQKVLYWFNRYHIEYQIQHTTYPGHATEIAYSSRNDRNLDGIIACGGDGTINEVLSGLIGSSMKIGVIPMGTGNVFAREMKIPFSPKKIAAIFASGNSILMDAGKSNRRYFFLMMSAGFDAYSIKHTEKINLKKIIGKLSYVIGGLKAFSRYQHPLIRVTIDGRITDQGSFVMISNTRKYAIWFTVTPEALPVDGYLDVYIFKEAGRWNLIKLLFNILLYSLSSKSRKREKIFLVKESFYQAKKVTLQSDAEVMTQIDGDLAEALPAEISILEKSIQVILPQSIIRKFSKIMNQKSKKKKE